MILRSCCFLDAKPVNPRTPQYAKPTGTRSKESNDNSLKAYDVHASMINSVMRRISWIFHRKSEAPASKNYEVMFLSYTQRVIHYCVAKYSNLLNITLHVVLMIHSFRISWILNRSLQNSENLGSNISSSVLSNGL